MAQSGQDGEDLIKGLLERVAGWRELNRIIVQHPEARNCENHYCLSVWRAGKEAPQNHVATGREPLSRK